MDNERFTFEYRNPELMEPEDWPIMVAGAIAIVLAPVVLLCALLFS